MLNLHQSQVVADALEHALQVLAKTSAMLEAGNSLESLPPSIVPTKMLFMLALSYRAIYGELETHKLLKSHEVLKHKNLH